MRFEHKAQRIGRRQRKYHAAAASATPHVTQTSIIKSPRPIAPGGSARLVGRVTKLVDTAAELKEARKAAEQARGKYPELVGIRRIECDDGSVWKRNPR